MAEQGDTLVHLYLRSCARYADRPALGTKGEDGWRWTTYRELKEQIDHFRGGLASLGIGEGDRVAIIANNRVEWVVACFAAHGLRASLVPMYEEQLAKDWRFILTDSGAKAVITASQPILDRVLDMQLPELHVIGIGLPDDDPRSFSALTRVGSARPVAVRHPDAETVANLVYTSGTTGDPKGVILTHGNIASNVTATIEVFPLEPDDRTLSFLPWAHSYGQVELYYVLTQGASTAINDAIPHLLENLAEVRPTMLVAVPRIFNRIYETVNQQIASKPAFMRRLFQAGIHSAVRRSQGQRLNTLERLQLAVDDRLVFDKIRKKFGGRLEFVLSASAALSREVAEFVDALGLTVYEGYGLSETSPVVSANTREHRKLGSVGRVIPGVRVEIDASKSEVPGHGEIIVYGPNVMRGYHNLPEANAEVFTPDGGLRTGDLGYLDEEGFLFITGRIKEQYKLETGKYVMPAPIEEHLKLSPFISNIMLYGANRPYNVALVVLDEGAVRRWAAENELEIGDLSSDPRVLQLIMGELSDRSSELKSYEVPRRALLLTEDFTTENDLLTPTMKLKRRNIEKRFRSKLDALYGEPAPTGKGIGDIHPS
ncbi:MAG: long-chain fatty acid--CoA ligase [Sandaracinaceae bacterium]|nr:long-chain fatty acid--CoA ligase [Sandaracinaceae bacterium]